MPHVLQQILAFMLLAVAAPFIAICLLGAWISTLQWPIFRQLRIGRNGKCFVIHKIRTVADSALPIWPTDDLPRRTRFGMFLRRFWLDEILQLWDVGRGKMNLVGPRPEMVEYFEYFSAQMPAYRQRSIAYPGITGLAQVSGYRNDTDVEERLRLDLAYIELRSWRFDIWILWLTVAEVLTNRCYREARRNPDGFADAITRAVVRSSDKQQASEASR